MHRYAPDASVVPPNRLDAEPDQVHSDPEESQPDENRSAFVLSQGPGLLAVLLRVFVLTREGPAEATRYQVAVRWSIAAVTVAFTMLLIVAGSSYASSDKDGDGVPNGRDNCLKVANPDQADLDGDSIGDVCDSDQDGDGVANTSDQCPDEPGSASNDGCPLPPPPVATGDRDGDGVANTCDQCPDEPGSASKDGCPSPPPPVHTGDRDGAGVANTSDQCPDEPGSASND